MTAWYNEIDPHAADWLRNLIARNLIAPGVVDERPIQDVKPIDIAGFSQCHFFAGIGGWSLALRLAHWPDHRPIWTGSCPCQSFSLAGKRGGFADDRHLWPFWRYLIEVGRPPVILGEQVAAASGWLKLVRGDLEAMGYPVGAIPVEAASTGADHLRDRYWFVAGDVALGDARGPRLAVGSFAEVERGDVWTERTPTATPGVGSFPVANPHLDGSRNGVLQRSWEFGGPGGDSQGRDSGDLSNSFSGRFRSERPREAAAAAETGMQGANEQREWFRPDVGAVRNAGEFEWVIGADNKARRVKPGVRLLADAVSGRVAVRRTVQRPDAEEEIEEHWYSRIKALKGFGNAIDPVCAAEFIKAVMECES